jgi:hypothetical protein
MANALRSETAMCSGVEVIDAALIRICPEGEEQQRASSLDICRSGVSRAAGTDYRGLTSRSDSCNTAQIARCDHERPRIPCNCAGARFGTVDAPLDTSSAGPASQPRRLMNRPPVATRQGCLGNGSDEEDGDR